ncbi:MAG TPA: hypothetical protein VFW09_18190 [Solirubrobacteraceae bacterium]|nr:hypothetical protein [Solirubrobacteraceae bacterium]
MADVGFTASLHICTLAFHGEQLREANIDVLATPLIASAGGFVAFRLLARLRPALRARQLARTAEGIVELSDDIDPEARPRPRWRECSGTNEDTPARA